MNRYILSYAYKNKVTGMIGSDIRIWDCGSKETKDNLLDQFKNEMNKNEHNDLIVSSVVLHKIGQSK